MKNILIIEDSKTLNNIIAKELKAKGYDVAQAFTFSQAKTQLKQKDFDLLILDLHLPDGEGSELIAHIQSLTKTKVVVLTSLQDEDLREELFSYGIVDYIIKDMNLIYSLMEIIKIIQKLQESKKEKILVIDDSKFVCKQIKTILEPRNYEVTFTYNAKEGLVALHQGEYDLLILDMELPDLHGLEVLRLIRKENRFLNLAIVVLSGFYTAEVVRDALKNGANDFLKKPFIFEEFILKIDLWLDYFKKEKALKQKTQQLQEFNKNLEGMVEQKVALLREKDKMLLQQSRHAQMGEMIAMIAHQWRQPLNIVGASVAALEQKVKLDKLDKTQFEVITQKIKHYLEYLSSTIDDFRNFFQPETKKSVTDFKQITSKALLLIKSSLEENDIAYVVEVKKLEPVLVYENEFIQVVLNLIKNAEDVLLERDIKDPKIIIRIEGTTLKVIDNAGGIPKEVFDQIFNPYFTTKHERNGTGLGLYMSKLIVEEHSFGRLYAKNTKEGAMFVIELQKESEV